MSITNWGLRGDNILSLTKTTDLRLRRANESNLQLPPVGNKISLGYIIFVQKALTWQINHEIGAETEYPRQRHQQFYLLGPRDTQTRPKRSEACILIYICPAAAYVYFVDGDGI